jgi:hypothetical protein
MLQYILQVTTLVLLPLYFIADLWRAKESDVFGWLLKLLYVGAFLAYVASVGRWDLLSYYVQYLFAALFLIAAVGSFRKIRALPFVAKQERRVIRYVASMLLLVTFSAFFIWSARGWFVSDEPASLEFPLSSGWYYVGQGGNSVAINYHNAYESQKYALDIVELNAMGSRARGFAPQELADYRIFGDTIRSPCDGRVLKAVNNFADQIPPASDRKNVAGNHVVLECDGIEILLAHMQKGSVSVAAGESVQVGDSLGRVGNSGNTSEPHLHIHAVQANTGGVMKGKAVPLLFDGEFLVRNSTVRGSDATSDRDAATK